MPQADMRGIEDGVSDGSGSDGNCSLSRTRRRHACRSYKDSLNGGYLVIKVQAFIGLPVDRGDAPFVPGNFFHQGTAHALQESTFDLVSQAIGIGNRSAIQGHDETHRAY